MWQKSEQNQRKCHGNDISTIQACGIILMLVFNGRVETPAPQNGYPNVPYVAYSGIG